MPPGRRGAPPAAGGQWCRGSTDAARRHGPARIVYAEDQRYFDVLDVGGAAIRVFSQYQGLPVYIVNSTFGGGSQYGNVCSNGGGLSSIGVSYTVINSLFSHNRAIGYGANPSRPGAPGGGSGGAIYNDGNTFTLNVVDTIIEEFYTSLEQTAENTGGLRASRSTSWKSLTGCSIIGF